MRIWTLLALGIVGCTGDLVDIGQKSGGSTAGDMAMATGGGGGGGGTSAADGGSTGGNVTFASIQTDLDAKICSSGACHGSANATSNGGFMLIANASGADLMTNYTAVMNEINTQMPAMSLLLTNPAGTATPPHTGGMLFSGGTNDPTYKKWLAWITAGAPQ